jgi:CubicO group peptidase (beta-lactamase class C family)
MRISRLVQIAIALALFAGLRREEFRAQPVSSVLSDAAIREILVERIDRYRQSVGIVVGVVEPSGRRIVSYGRLAAGDSRALTGDTVFEIGSITKVFTSLLLTDMAERKEVQLTDAVANYLPPEVRVPQRNGEQITLKDLSTHTSALPRMPTNIDSAQPDNPFADYSVPRLYEFLSAYELPRTIGSRFEYSNIGGALLGHALARRAGMDYETLIETRITGPLGMNSTRTTPTPEMKERLAIGHAYALAPTPAWDLGALSAAGALRSTANDLLTFLSANLGYTKTPLAPAMAAMLKFRRKMEQEEVGLGWFIRAQEGNEVVFHEGSTGGYRSFMGYDSKAGVGVVVLSNAGTGAGVGDIGMHLLNSGNPILGREVLEPPRERKATAIDSYILDSYAGRYAFSGGQILSVTREEDHLVLQADGLVKIAFYPETVHDFFAKITDAQIVFETDPQNRILQVFFYNGGPAQRLRRIE